MRAYAGFLLTLPMLSACAATPSYRHEVANSPVFSPIAFFGGDTVGEGSLKIDLLHVRPVHVVGHGQIAADGTLTLVQHVREGEKPERLRTWHIRPIGGDRYTGTLSDAVGPVHVESHGNALHIAYAAKGGLRIEQWLFLKPGGQVATNHLVVRKLGIRIAALNETISRR
ncbi:DUF3833 family protein [Sphingomonas bacterium]|uniref:DUF3833 family protein n=1 Tax=Sphingomonas bacterium TaxID=1895847 RepID=UPI0015759E0F|nr:DUF3833 family protein [Sphingomonas bacterium]